MADTTYQPIRIPEGLLQALAQRQSPGAAATQAFTQNFTPGLNQGLQGLAQGIARQKQKQQWQKTVNELMQNPNIPAQYKQLGPALLQAGPEQGISLIQSMMNQSQQKPPTPFRSTPFMSGDHPVSFNESTGRYQASDIDAQKPSTPTPYLDYRNNQLEYLKTRMRDQLMKEGRDVLNPYFQKGAGQDNAKRLDSISRAKPLVDQMLSQSGGGDPRQMVELATSLDRVIKGGGQSAQAQIEHLIPQTALGKAKNWQEWFSNNPTGLMQQAFIKRYKETLDREEKAIKGRVTTMALSNAPTLRVLKQNYPNDFNALLDSVLKNPEITMSPDTQGQGDPLGIR